MALLDEKYVLLTTFRRDGTPVATPVWVAPLSESSFGFWTSSGSGKAKRLAHTEHVTIQPCNGRGVVKPGSAVLDGTARVVTGPAYEDIRKKIIAKYGPMTKVAHLFGTIGGILQRNRIPYGDRGVVVSIGR